MKARGSFKDHLQLTLANQQLTEELKLQLGDRLPAAMTIAAKAMNMEMKEFTKAMEEGAITAEEFMPVFTKAMQEMAAPGLDKSFKTMNVAWKRMTQNFNLFVKALFESGVGDLFTKIFNTLSDIFQMAAPVVSLIGAFASTILKVLIFPIRLAIAMIRDMVVMIDWWMKDTFGTGLNELLKNIGTIGGYLVSLFSSLWSIIGKILKPIGWLVGKIGDLFKSVSPTYQLGKQALSGRSEQIGKITGAFKDAGGRAAEIGKGVMMSRYTQGAAAGELGGQAGNYIFTEANIKLTGKGAEIFERDTRAETTRTIGSNVRG